MKRKNGFTKMVMAIAMMICLAFILPAQAKKVMSAKDFIAECRQQIKEINIENARIMFDSGEWSFLDCRTDKEFKRGSVPNATHVKRGVLEFKIEKKFPDKSAKIVVFCKSGSRSTLSVCTLTKMGYTNVVSMSGGWKKWVSDGHPVS